MMKNMSKNRYFASSLVLISWQVLHKGWSSMVMVDNGNIEISIAGKRLEEKCPLGNLPTGNQQTRFLKNVGGQISWWANFLVGKFPVGKFPGGQFSSGQISGGQISRWADFRWANFLQPNIVAEKWKYPKNPKLDIRISGYPDSGYLRYYPSYHSCQIS